MKLNDLIAAILLAVVTWAAYWLMTRFPDAFISY
jgi:hypothetical protein